MERFNLKKLDQIEGKGQYRAEVWNGFAALEALDSGSSHISNMLKNFTVIIENP
jgi:hypothetical protein